MYNKKTHVHFVGIGGIGMSGIAKILRNQGYYISGCDVDLEQHSIQELQKLGCAIYKGNNTDACKDESIDIVVYSSAIKNDYPEIIAAQERGIPTIARALMLAELMRTKFSVAITGAHGKTTTTSLIAHILLEAHKDPTVIVGGHLKNISSNARFGNGDVLVAEADESDRSLLRLYPTLAVVTNIDLEHLDVYTDINDIKNTYKQFLDNIPFYGKAIVCSDNIYIREILPLAHIKTIKYGIDSEADFYARDINLYPDHVIFDAYYKQQLLGNVKLAMPGRHNILNSLAAIAVALEFDVPFSTISQALSSFKGIERRFSFKGTYKGAAVFDDYGHHPTEIAATLQVARLRAQKKLTVIFEPHRYSRLQKLWPDFIKVFLQEPIDHLIITDVYPASEAPIPNINAESFVKALQQYPLKYPVTYIPFEKNYTQLEQQVAAITHKDDLILLLGAGKINKFADVIVEKP